MHDLVKGHITFSGLVQFHFLFSLPEKLIQSKSIWSLVFSGCVFLFTYKVEKIISRNLFIRIFVLIKPDLFSFFCFSASLRNEGKSDLEDLEFLVLLIWSKNRSSAWERRIKDLFKVIPCLPRLEEKKCFHQNDKWSHHSLNHLSWNVH